MTAAIVPPAGAHPERELVTTRLIPFPPERVLEAWTAGDRLARWWGPNGFTNAFELFDPRPGGAWRFVMQGPDGARFPNESRFLELGPGRIVVRHLSRPVFDLMVTLAEEAGATRVTWCQRFESAEVLEKVRSFAPSGNEQNLDRLEAELRRGQGGPH